MDLRGNRLVEAHVNIYTQATKTEVLEFDVYFSVLP